MRAPSEIEVPLVNTAFFPLDPGAKELPPRIRQDSALSIEQIRKAGPTGYHRS